MTISDITQIHDRNGRATYPNRKVMKTKDSGSRKWKKIKWTTCSNTNANANNV